VPENPVPYHPDADVPLDTAPIQGVNDQRVQAVAERAAGFQQFIREMLPPSPNVELACRHVDLAVQAAYEAGQESPPAAPGEPTEQP